ncbi:MAG: FmdB family zinc ribbon protein [Acidobacteriota bacterium]
MPIYEFYCEDCHRIYRFLSRRVDTSKRPSCPRCEREGLERRPSTFAVSRGLEEADADDPLADVDEAALERAMAELASEAEHMDEDDPRQAAQLMRRMFQATGMPMGDAMQEMLGRMEAGEDPEALEEEYGDLLDEDPLLGEGEGASGAAGPRLERLRRRLPPNVDPELHEM